MVFHHPLIYFPSTNYHNVRVYPQSCLCLDIPHQLSSCRTVSNVFCFSMLLSDLWSLATLQSWFTKRDICPRKSISLLVSYYILDFLLSGFLSKQLSVGVGRVGKSAGILCFLRDCYSVPRFYRGENITGSCYLSISKEISSQNTKISLQQMKVNNVVNAKEHAILLLFSISGTPTHKTSSSLLFSSLQTQNCSGCSKNFSSEL